MKNIDPFPEMGERFIVIASFTIYLLSGSLIEGTSHFRVGDRHIFCYTWMKMAWAVGFNLLPAAMAWYLWRVKKDKVLAGLFICAIPVYCCFVMPQHFMERVEITPTHLIHRREPPHTRFNADIAFTNIASAVELHLDKGTKGYRIVLKNGSVLELPANTIMTAARDTIAAELSTRSIPVTNLAIHKVPR